MPSRSMSTRQGGWTPPRYVVGREEGASRGRVVSTQLEVDRERGCYKRKGKSTGKKTKELKLPGEEEATQRAEGRNGV